jgi:hypothetical protein
VGRRSTRRAAARANEGGTSRPVRRLQLPAGPVWPERQGVPQHWMRRSRRASANGAGAPRQQGLRARPQPPLPAEPPRIPTQHPATGRAASTARRRAIGVGFRAVRWHWAASRLPRIAQANRSGRAFPKPPPNNSRRARKICARPMSRPATCRRRFMPRSISAPTIAASWSRSRPGRASFASSMPFPASSGSARGSARAAGFPMVRWSAPSRR